MRSFLLACAGVVLCGGCFASEAQPFTFQVPKLYPAVGSKWREELAGNTAMLDDWLYNLKGVSVPLQHVTVAGKPLIIGAVCKPADCGDNRAAILFAASGNRVVGIVALRSSSRVVGSPSVAETRCLNRFISNGDIAGCM
jgi:hypothetical protein